MFKKEKNKILIVTATKNRPELLKICLSSIVGQTERDFVCVVVNSGKRTEVQRCIEYFNDPRIVYTKSTIKNSAAAARSRGLCFMSEEFSYVKFLDDDDQFENKNSLKNLRDTAEKSKADLVYGRQRRIDLQNNTLNLTPKGPLDLEFILKNASFPFSSTLFSKSLIVKLGGFTYLTSSEDLELICRTFLLSQSSDIKIVYLDKVLARYRKHTDSLNFINRQNGEKDFATNLLRSRFGGNLYA